jgi:hypothetical protein
VTDAEGSEARYPRPLFIRETIKAIDSLEPPDEDRRTIYCGNAQRLLGLPDPRD